MTTQLLISEETELLSEHEIVSPEEWLVARKDLLSNEKQLTRLRDKLAAERRALPWVKIEKEYVFDAPEGKVTLADLFAGRSQLVIYHFMFGPDQRTGHVVWWLPCDVPHSHWGSLASSLPHIAYRCRTSGMQGILGKLLKRGGWDGIVFDGISTGWALPRVLDHPPCRPTRPATPDLRLAQS